MRVTSGPTLHIFIGCILIAILTIGQAAPGDPSHQPQLQTATYHTHESHFLGRTYNFTTYEAQFDDDLYVLRQWPCPCVDPGHVCPPNVNPSSIAPYVDETGYNITTLIKDEWFESEIDSNYEIQYVRFQLLPDPTIPCPVIHIDKETQTGALSMFLFSRKIPSSASHLWYSPYFGYSRISICPTHPNFTYGAYYGSFVNQRSANLNRFKVRYTVTNSPTCTAAVTPPGPPPPQVTWLTDGVPAYETLSFGETAYYALHTLGRCTFFSTSVNKITEDGDLDMFVSIDNQYPNIYNSSSHQWHSTVDGDDRVNIHYCNPDLFATSNTFYIGIRATAPGEAPFYLVATTQQLEEPYPLASLAYYQQRIELSYGAAPYMTCSSDQVFSCAFPTYSDCNNDLFRCCYRFGPQVPSAVVQTLWPWNEADKTIGDVAWSIPWNKTEPTVKGKLAWSLYLGTSTPTSKDEFFHGDPGTCTLTLKNAIVARNGSALQDLQIKFAPKPLACDPALFEAAKTKIDGLSEDLLVVGDGEYDSLALAVLELQIEAHNPIISGCEALIESFTTSSDTAFTYDGTRNCYQEPGSPAWLSDVCCQPHLMYSQCCNPRNETFIQSVPAVVNKALVQSQCKSAECSEKTVSAWAGTSKVQNSQQQGCDTILASSASFADIATATNFILDCRSSIAGEDLLGISCELDSECTRTGSSCNITTKRCTYTDAEVLECVIDSMPETVQRSLFNSWQITSPITKTVLREQLMQRLFKSQCMGPTGRLYRQGYVWSPQVSSCTDQCSADNAFPICFDRTCPIPRYCDGAVTAGACYRFWAPLLTDNAGCIAEKDCNWMRCANSPTCAADCVAPGTDVCLDCTKPGGCIEQTNITTTARCAQGLCTSDSSITDANACSAKGFCSGSCPGCDQPSCMASGVCSDIKELADGMTSVGAVGGVCVTPVIFPAGTVTRTCPPGTTGTILTIGCLINETDSLVCDGMADASWYHLALTKAECETAKSCFDTESASFQGMSQSSCVACQGHTWKNIFNWTPNHWKQGVLLKLEWSSRQFVSVNKVETSLDYTAMMQLVSNAVTSRYSYAYRTHALCQFDTSMRLINSAACDCSGQGGNDCFAAIGNSQVGVGLVCPYLPSTISTSAGYLEIQRDTYPEELCGEVSLYYTPPEQYQLDSTKTFNQALFRASAVNSFWIVKNDDLAAIGQIVSGAVRLETPTEFAQPAHLCINIILDLPQAKIAVVLSFARLNEDEEPVVIDSEVYQTGDRVCGYVKEAGTYFAVKVVEDYRTKKLVSASAVVQDHLGAAIFLLVALFGIIQAVLLIMARHEERILRLKLCFISIIVINCIIRAIYISLPSNAFRPSTAALQFVIFELPTFLFFSVFTCIVYLWLMVVAKTGVMGNRVAVKKRQTVMKRIFIAGNAVMYLIFILFIILIAILPALQDVAPCFIGGANSNTANNSVSRDIKLGYWIFQAVICIVVSFIFLGAAFALLKLLQASQKVNAKAASKGRRSTPIMIITVVAVVCSVLLLARSAYFLWSAVTLIPVYVMVFVLLECIPQALLLFYLHPFSMFREASTQAGTSSNGFKTTSTEHSKTSTVVTPRLRSWHSQAPSADSSSVSEVAMVPLENETPIPPASPLAATSVPSSPDTPRRKAKKSGAKRTGKKTRAAKASSSNPQAGHD